MVGESSQNTSASATPTVLTDDQALTALQVTQQAAQVAIQQLQQGHGLTLASDQDGQQIYVVADSTQLEALQVSAVTRNAIVLGLLLSRVFCLFFFLFVANFQGCVYLSATCSATEPGNTAKCRGYTSFPGKSWGQYCQSRRTRK